MFLPDFSKLCVDSPSRNSHYNRLGRSNFVVCNPFFLGNAKVVFHSGVAPERKCRREVDEYSSFFFQEFILSCRVIECPISLFLFVWQHDSPQ